MVKTQQNQTLIKNKGFKLGIHLNQEHSSNLIRQIENLISEICTFII